jgi:hypothetical protein
MKSMRNFLPAVLVAAVLGFGAPASAHDDAGAIQHLMMSMFDKPEARLSVEPVVVEGDVAVAGWAQGERGGRALLRRKDGEWKLILCSGDALKQAAALEQFGLTAEQAKTLADGLGAAEAKLDPKQVAKFSLFDGVVTMDGEGNHPEGDHSGHNDPQQ